MAVGILPAMRTTRVLSFLTILAAPAIALAADAPASVTTPAATKPIPGLHEKLAAFVEKKEVAGVVALVADKDGVVGVDTAGFADVASGKPMPVDAMMWIASMTKPVTAVGLMMLVDEGKLSVDDPVAKYVPEFADVKTPSGKSANLTIRHLMTHTSGLREPPVEVSKKATKLADLIPSIVAQPTLFEPGSKWSYCQSGINTGGRIIEVVSGQSYPDFLQQRIFSPLGMADTTFYPMAEQLPRIAKTYKLDKGELSEAPLGFLNGKSPSDTDRYPLANGGLFSTAGDYAKFLRMVLNKGTVDGKTYLSPKAVEQMTTIQSGDVVTGFTPGNGWGIGWCVVKEPQGVTASLSPGSCGHGGAYGTQAWIDPTKNLIYVLMIQRSNVGNSDGSELRKVFHDTVVTALGK
jgi:CubicO group peptidase (beta-lactamase class C family)